MPISKADAEALRDAIQGLITAFNVRPNSKSERDELFQDYQTIERLTNDPFPVPGEDAAAWAFRFRTSAWKAYKHAIDGLPAPAEEVMHLRECQDLLRVLPGLNSASETVPPAAGPSDTLEGLVAGFLQSVPETWTEYDPAKLTELQEKAIYSLTAAGMIERRITLCVRMFGHPEAVEVTVTLTGESGLAEALEPVTANMYGYWRDEFEKRKAGELKDATAFHSERIGKEQWRLTAEGTVARRDLAEGNSNIVFDFVLKRGFYDGQPHLLPDGRISQRLSVAGTGKLERMRRVLADAGPTGVNITNWDAGAKAFAAAFADPMKAHAMQSSPPAATAPPAGEKSEGGTPPANRSKGVPLGEAEIRVREWLAANAKDNPAAITRDAVAAGTGVSGATVSRTTAWKAFRDRRNAEAKPGTREVPLTDAMQSVMPADCERPDELAALIEEQTADEAEQERRRRSRSEPF